jgi:predicted nuclease of predicted toxin-antitoxin system
VKLLDFPLLSDENIAPDIVAALRTRGCDLRTAWDEQLIGRRDVDVLDHATSQGRVVLTHDLAFGRFAIRSWTPLSESFTCGPDTSRRRSCST